MNVLDLIGELRYAAGTSGGEWHGPCPWCGGKDRFMVWPHHPSGAIGGRYYCRQCEKCGDAIQLLRDRDGMTYPEACSSLQVVSKAGGKRANRTSRILSWEPAVRVMPPALWQQQAKNFVSECSVRMVVNSEGMKYAFSRGLTIETVVRLGIGWNDRTRYADREEWGLPPDQKEKCKPHRLWLPPGLVIPSRRKVGLVGLKIRRSLWTPEDDYPKYAAVAGSVPGLALGAGYDKPVVIVESEIDAILIWQEARDIVTAVSLGTAKVKPDVQAAAYLRAAPRILVALDYDSAGIAAMPWWCQTFPQAELWPTPEGKDVGNLTKVPGYVRAWLQAAFV